jgi:hypothetical protein
MIARIRSTILIMNDMPPEYFEHEDETEFDRDPTSPVFTDDLTDLDDD